MVYITAIHVEGAEYHEHIVSVKWRNPSTAVEDVSTREQMVEWIRAGGDARVANGGSGIQVVVVAANPPYLRTEANGRRTDNLLSLPRF